MKQWKYQTAFVENLLSEAVDRINEVTKFGKLNETTGFKLNRQNQEKDLSDMLGTR